MILPFEDKFVQKSIYVLQVIYGKHKIYLHDLKLN